MKCHHRRHCICRTPPFIAAPGELSAHAADTLIEWLRDIAYAIEEHYGDDLEQYRCQPDPRQHDLWPKHDPPF